MSNENLYRWILGLLCGIVVLVFAHILNAGYLIAIPLFIFGLALRCVVRPDRVRTRRVRRCLHRGAQKTYRCAGERAKEEAAGKGRGE